MAKNDIVDFHNRIRLLRTERGVSRQALADAVGVHVQTIGYIERRQEQAGEQTSGNDSTNRFSLQSGGQAAVEVAIHPVLREADHCSTHLVKNRLYPIFNSGSSPVTQVTLSDIHMTGGIGLKTTHWRPSVSGPEADGALNGPVSSH